MYRISTMQSRKLNTKKILLSLTILSLVIITGVLAFFVLQSNSTINEASVDVTITLSEEGFSPEKITINKGDTVLFKTTRETYFWPASNLHPTHELYSEFDPQEPIDPQQSWSFTFEETGQWQYHDHLAPYYTGTITVKE